LRTENAIRPTALAKKNWLFFGDADAGERSAILYSIIESCRRHDIEPYTYLHEVLTRLPSMTNRQIKTLFQKPGQQPGKTLLLEQPKHCNCHNSNLRPLQFLRVNRSMQGAWRDAYEFLNLRLGELAILPAGFEQMQWALPGKSNALG
jgi:hypothetical protein